MPVRDPEDSEAVYLTDLDAAIISDIIGHPYELPTLTELAYTNGDTDRDRIARRLEALERQDVTTTVTFIDGPPKESFPGTFYGLTDFGRDLFFRRVPNVTEQHLKTAYARMQKPTEIETYERAPRPQRAGAEQQDQSD